MITAELSKLCEPFVDPDKGVHSEAEALAGDEHRILPLDRIDQQQGSAADREEPEGDRNDRAPDPLRCDPLDHETHHEKSLGDEAKHDPEIELLDKDGVEPVE